MSPFRKVLSAIAAVTMAAGVVFVLAAPASASAPNAKVVDLTQARAAARPDVQHAPIAGVIPRAGRISGQATVAGTCAEPACPLLYNGGEVQTHPRVYLLLWGPSWGTDSGHQATAAYMENFYSGLGGQPSDSWSTINDQYYGSNGTLSFNGSVYAGVWQDTSTPPNGVDWNGLASEADGLANTLSITDRINAQIVVATQDGTCPSGFYAPSCGGTGNYCAWHSESNEPFTNMPYVTGPGSGCGENWVNSGTAGTYDGFSIVGGHEYAETISDPSPYSGWWDPNDGVNGSENADKCAWRDPMGNLNLTTGSFAVQSIWSNTSNACVLSAPQPQAATLTVSRAGSGSGTVSSQPLGIGCGSACSANFPSGSTVTLSAGSDSGSTFAGWSGACTGTSATCTVTMSGNRAVTATFTSIPCPDIALEPDNSPAQARAQSVGTTQHRAFCTANDQDWVKFSAAAGGSYNLQTLNLTPGTDTVLELYGTDGTTLLASNDDSNGSLASQITFTPTTAGTYYLKARNYSGAGDPSYTYDLQVVGATARFEETAVQFEGWFLWSDPTASGGSWRTSSVTNNTASFAFSGTSVTWLSNKGRNRGIAAVTIDGVAKGTVDLYSATPASFSKAFSGLSSSAHTIVIKVTGTKNAAATATNVVLDGFTVGTTTTQENAKPIAYNTWKGGSSANASGGAYRSSGSAGAVAQLTFSGTSVSWITTVGTGWGKAEVYIDGVDRGPVDLYATTGRWQTLKTYSGLSAGSHTIKVKVLGTKNPASTATTVPIDGFQVS